MDLQLMFPVIAIIKVIIIVIIIIIIIIITILLSFFSNLRQTPMLQDLE